MKKVILSTLAVFSIAAATFAQGTWTLDKAHAKLAFVVTHLSISEVDGQFTSFDAKVTASKEDFSDAVFELSADISSVTTNNSGRDGHLQKPDMFDVANHPKLTFKSTGITKTGDKTYKLAGDLTMKGVTKPVSLDLKHLGSTKGRDGKAIAGFKVSGSVKRTDFGIGGMPSAMVSDEIELRASGEFKGN
jgi:polyisoprenoid-binding protein YceI